MEIILDTISYNAAISSCEKGHQQQHCIELLQDMPRRRLQPDLVSYSAAVLSCSNVQQPVGMFYLFDKMIANDVAPDGSIYGMLLVWCEHWGHHCLEADLLNEMRSVD